ncbi:hypothetical protein WJ970_19935 [Achromobacter xylosoxidans]
MDLQPLLLTRERNAFFIESPSGLERVPIRENLVMIPSKAESPRGRGALDRGHASASAHLPRGQQLPFEFFIHIRSP